MTKSDSVIRDDVQAELAWDPRVHDARRIAVAVNSGVTTLAGTLETFGDKWAAERAAERVTGVRAVANEIEVRPSDSLERTDDVLALAVVNALAASSAVPADHIQAIVRKGWVTLEGEVSQRYHREAAEQAVRFLIGVKGISNDITVKAPVSETVVKSDIEAALKRIAAVDAASIGVHADGHSVTLSGLVRSSAERRAAEYAAWAAPGVNAVENRIAVGQ
jgi:osmotically-inducible protein OsmY